MPYYRRVTCTRFWSTFRIQQQHGVKHSRYIDEHTGMFETPEYVYFCIDRSYHPQEDMEEADSPMEEEPSLAYPPVCEAELDRLAGVLEELHHLLETAPYCMVQPPGKAFPTSARITGPQERDDPYPALYRYIFTC